MSTANVCWLTVGDNRKRTIGRKRIVRFYCQSGSVFDNEQLIAALLKFVLGFSDLDQVLLFEIGDNIVC